MRLLLLTLTLVCVAMAADDKTSAIMMKLFNLLKEKRQQCPAATSSFTKEQQDAFVAKHNEYRKQQGSSNMRKLVWNDEIAGIAQQLVDKNQEWGEMKHGMTKDCSGHDIGQNLAGGGQIDGVVDRWYNEVANTVYAPIKKDCPRLAEGKQCWHYTQVVWAKTTEVGCGVSKGAAGTIVGCDYRTAGNHPDQYPFKKGKACSECGNDGGNWASGYKCEDGLCVDCDVDTDSDCKCPTCAPDTAECTDFLRSHCGDPKYGGGAAKSCPYTCTNGCNGPLKCRKGDTCPDCNSQFWYFKWKKTNGYKCAYGLCEECDLDKDSDCKCPTCAPDTAKCTDFMRSHCGDPKYGGWAAKECPTSCNCKDINAKCKKEEDLTVSKCPICAPDTDECTDFERGFCGDPTYGGWASGKCPTSCDCKDIDATCKKEEDSRDISKKHMKMSAAQTLRRMVEMLAWKDGQK